MYRYVTKVKKIFKSFVLYFFSHFKYLVLKLYVQYKIHPARVLDLEDLPLHFFICYYTIVQNSI